MFFMFSIHSLNDPMIGNHLRLREKVEINGVREFGQKADYVKFEDLFQLS